PALERQRIAVAGTRLLQAALLEQPEHGPGTGILERPRARRRRWIEYEPGIAHAIRAGPRDLRRALWTKCIGHRRVTECERHLLRPGVQRKRRNVETHGRGIAAGTEEQIADHGRPLKLREVRRCDRSR